MSKKSTQDQQANVEATIVEVPQSFTVLDAGLRTTADLTRLHCAIMMDVIKKRVDLRTAAQLTNNAREVLKEAAFRHAVNTANAKTASKGMPLIE